MSRKSLIALPLTAMLFAPTAVSPPPAAASYYEEGLTFSREIVRNGVSYKLTIKAFHSMGNLGLEAKIVKIDDPDGATRARQTQRWRFDLSPEEFSYDYDTDTFHIDAGSDSGAFRVKFDAVRREETCSDSEAYFVEASEDNAFRIETDNTVFGTLSGVPECADRYIYSSGTPDSRRCPFEGESIDTSNLRVEAPRSADLARVRAAVVSEVDISGDTAEWSAIVYGEVPANRFKLERDFDGRFEPRGAPWLQGTARIDGRGSIERTGWRSCKGGREARTRIRDIEVTGDLTLDVIGSEDAYLANKRGWGFRSWVRPRS